MVYMGSKAKYADEIVPILQDYIDKNNIQIYVEPFCGGANIADKIKCPTKLCFDKNVSLIALHQCGQDTPEIIPKTGNQQWFNEARTIYRNYQGSAEMEKEMPLWQIGAIQYFASFSKRGFSGGYGNNTNERDYYNESYNNFMKQIQSPLYKDIKFAVADYQDLDFENALIYCDPPYQGTKAYGYAFETKFNYNNYWDWVREQSKKNIVICSEQNFPDDFTIIWEKKVKRTNGKENNYKAVEKLGIIK